MQKTILLQTGKYYHIYNRGNNRENVFFEDRNYTHFMNLYARYIEPVVDTFAYCLLRNHFHFLVRIKDLQGLQDLEGLTANRKVLQQFSNFFNSYSKAINKAYQRTGALFEHGFSRIEVTSDRYFVALVRYIHFNPQKHNFVKDFREYSYSSYHALYSAQPTLLKREEVLSWFNGREGFQKFHQSGIEENKIRHLIADDNV